MPGVRGEALRLEELRLTATEDLIEARLDRGDDARTVAELEALVAPIRCGSGSGASSWWPCTAGRQAEALRRFAELANNASRPDGPQPIDGG